MHALRGLGLAVVFLGGGCYDSSAYWALGSQASGGSSSSTGAGPGDATSSISTTTWVTTSGGDSEGGTEGSDTAGDDSTSGGAPADPPLDPPPTVSFDASPTALAEAGPVTIEVEHSPDVEQLYLLDGGELVADWQPSEPPPDYLILQKEGPSRTLQVLAVDGSGQEALSEEVLIQTDLPEPGTELWKKPLDLGQPVEGHALSSGEGTSGSIELLVGAAVSWQGLVGRLTAQGEPATVSQPIEGGQSWIGGIAHGPDGEAIVVGTEFVGNQPRPWLARVSPLGDILDLDHGKLGDTATGSAVDPVTGRVYVSGYRKTPNPKGAFDAMVWAYGANGSPLWEYQWERPLPVQAASGDARDLGWGIAVAKSADANAPHDIVLVGESYLEVKDTEQYRAFVRRYSAGGELLAEWMSNTPPIEQAGARCALGDDEGNVMVGGWSSFDPAQVRSATIFFFTPVLEPQATHLHGGKGQELVTDLARLPNDDILYIADVDIADEDRHDFELRALTTPLGELLWSKVFADATTVRGSGLTVTPHGHIVVLGTATIADQSELTLASFHP